MWVNFSEGGGRRIFSGPIRGGEGILKVNRGGGEGFFKLEIERPDQKFLSSIAWPLKDFPQSLHKNPSEAILKLNYQLIS